MAIKVILRVTCIQKPNYPMAEERWNIPMVAFTREIGTKVNGMAMAEQFFPIAIVMKDSMIMINVMDVASMIGVMDDVIGVNFKRINVMVREFIPGRMEPNMKEPLPRVYDMALGRIPFEMGVSTRDYGNVENIMDKENVDGPMVVSTRENG